MIPRMLVGLVYDLRSAYLAEGLPEEHVAEFDSEATVEAIESAVAACGHIPERIGHGRQLCARLAAGNRWDLVVNIAEGLRGRSREAQVPCLLEMFGVNYTFSDPLVCAATLDKAFAKRLVRDAGLHTAPFAVVAGEEDIHRIALEYPLFAKPVAEGTSKGIDARSRINGPGALRTVCRRLLRRFRQPVLVEQYLPGREFTTAILGTGAEARVLGSMEIALRAGVPCADYSYEIKERCEEFVDYRPAEPGPLRQEVDELALAAYRAFECRDAGRVDTRLDAGGRPCFLEINPLPGLHPTHSDLPIIAALEGMPYIDLIGAILGSASRRAVALQGESHAPSLRRRARPVQRAAVLAR